MTKTNGFASVCEMFTIVRCQVFHINNTHTNIFQQQCSLIQPILISHLSQMPVTNLTGNCLKLYSACPMMLCTYLVVQYGYVKLDVELKINNDTFSQIIASPIVAIYTR